MGLMNRRIALLITLATLAFAQPPAQPAKAIPPTDAALRAAAPAEWLNYGRDYAETHYSPLAQITAANVANLKPAWTFDLSAAGSPTGPLEATPLVSNGVMYVSGQWSTVFAIDIKSGSLKWKYDPQLPRTGGPRLCCGSVNRGVALYQGKIFIGMLDARLVALDAADGHVLWEIGRAHV